MTAVAFRCDRFENEDRSGLEFHISADFGMGHCAYAVGCALLITDDPARDVPAGAVMLVIAPGEECAELLVLDQEIDVDQRGDATDEKEYGLGQARMWIADGTFERSYRLVIEGHELFTRIAWGVM
jgi:hypothetical protein